MDSDNIELACLKKEETVTFLFGTSTFTMLSMTLGLMLVMKPLEDELYIDKKAYKFT